MLAQNFRTAADLGISDQMLSDLIQTLGRMERGEITDERFTMHAIGSPDCGTSGCIMGWARGRRTNKAWPVAGDILDRSDGLSRLFFPHHVQNGFRANVEEAAMALRSYLSTGEANWAEALAS